jgi:hypothetical protein
MSELEKQTWRDWLKAAGIRAVKTMAEFALVMTGANAFNVFTADWYTIVGFALSGAVVSILISLAGLPEAESPVRGE